MAVSSGKRRSRISIVWRLFLSVTLCIVLLLVVNWLLNNFVLSSYYRQVKQGALHDAFVRVESLLQNGTNVTITLSLIHI